MDKAQFTHQLAQWLKLYLDSKYSDQFQQIEVIEPTQDLKRLNHPALRAINGSSSWEFKPDVIGVLSGQGQESRVVFITRSTKAISLKEIGEMHCYARLANPLLAMLLSPKAASSEVNGILLDKDMQHRVLNYGGEQPLFVLGWDTEAQAIDLSSVTPYEYKSLFAS